MLKCAHCDKEFKYESERKRHQESHFPQFECTVCSKKFSFLSALRRHQKQHERKGSVQCGLCGGSFRDEILLKRHIQYAHTGTYSCLDCSTVFSSEQALRTHSKIHKPESERRFRCTFEGCKKTFNFLHHLKHHALTHTNAKQHFCNVCGKGFIQSHHWKTHVKSHLTENWSFCSVSGCKKVFTSKNALKRHLAAHNKLTDGNTTEIRFDSGISSDSNSACDVHEKTEKGDNILCATCGKLILRLQYLNHKVQCMPADPKQPDCSEIEGSLFQNSNLELHGSSKSTYQSSQDNYLTDVNENYPSVFSAVNRASISGYKDICNSGITVILDENKNNREATINEIPKFAVDRSSSCSGHTVNNITMKSKCSCSCINNNMPEIEYRKDGIVKIRETFDADIVIIEAPEVLKTKVKIELNDFKNVPFNSCKAILGNCIVSEDGSVGEGCLCAKMIIDEHHLSAQEIDELTPNPNAVWV